jgi:homoserine dehydrogenase
MRRAGLRTVNVKGESIKIGVVGLGTVGGGVVSALRRNRAVVKARCGVDVEVRRVADIDEKRLKSTRLPAKCLTRDYRDIVNDPEVHILVELVGGTGIAHKIVVEALRAGKHVVTANKALVAMNWRELFSLAHRQRCAIGFEASVMAGVPIIRTLEEGLAGNNIRSIHAILNGTSNFILTRMDRRGMEMKRAIEEARKRGLCEADHRLDTEGFDAQQKLSILASIATGKWLPPKEVSREGIGNIEKQDILEARDQFGYALRPLAIFKRAAGRIEARVHPTFVPLDHPLANIENERNAALIEADNAGPVTIAGKGAGDKPAASGVISDIIALARAIRQRGHEGILVPHPPDGDRLRVAPAGEIVSKFYLRFSVVDRPGVLSFISGALGKNNVSIATCHQRGRSEKGNVSIFMTTHQARDGSLRKALAQIDRTRNIVKRPTVAIHIEE